LLVGPVFTREAVTAPRRVKLYVSRTAYVSAFWVLMLTVWMVLTGTQSVRNLGDLARFGTMLFRILATLQLAVVLFFSALSTASAVALEKDRRTLDLLLMTRLSNSELVLGKLLASMLNVLVLLAAALPFFLLTALFGGVSFSQILRVFAVTLLAALAAGSLGSVVALWREKTFQTLALTTLLLVFWPIAWEIVRGAYADRPWSDFAAAVFSPVHMILRATQPMTEFQAIPGWLGNPVNAFLLAAFAAAVLLNGLAIWRVRIWNPPREAGGTPLEEPSESIFGPDSRQEARGLTAPLPLEVPAARSAPNTREVWDNPVIWREMCTWAHGRKVVLVKVGYLLLAALSFAWIYVLAQGPTGVSGGAAAPALVPVFLLSLMLINAQGVTSLTNERDARALDLLLVTDLTPREFVFGKLGGIFFNTKEMVVIPLLLCGYLWYFGGLTSSTSSGGENLVYLVVGLLVMDVFVAMLGVHTGMAYANSRTAIATSLGTVFFLFVGVATCMWIMVAFGGGSFQVQLAPFVAFMLGGGVGLYVALGIRNPSPAIGLASLLCPFATFFAITSFVLGNTLSVLLVVVGTYGFTTAAMFIPALYEFDVATGRTTGAEE
jgi:ABC-type transport system involved in multi-copper enzyme maturation permease subunit